MDKKIVSFGIRLPGNYHDALRRYAFERRVSIHALIIEAIELLFSAKLGKEFAELRNAPSK